MRFSTFCLVYGLALVLTGLWTWNVAWAAGADVLGVAGLVLAVGAESAHSHTLPRTATAGTTPLEGRPLK